MVGRFKFVEFWKCSFEINLFKCTKQRIVVIESLYCTIDTLYCVLYVVWVIFDGGTKCINFELVKT